MNAAQRRKVARELFQELRSMAATDSEKAFVDLAEELKKLTLENQRLNELLWKQKESNQ